jgi:hypothetical protein
MDGAEKIKLALDETRTLVLGAQVLLGFQLQSAFQPRFDRLADTAKGLSVGNLLLMVIVVGLLVTPAIHHRIVDHGDATSGSLRMATRVMAFALVPFAASLGISVYIGLQSIFGKAQAITGAAVASLSALWFWYGVEYVALACKTPNRMAEMHEKIPLIKKIDQMLTEARVILPGAQALLGFQLIVVLSDAFERLPVQEQMVHGLALGCVALATVLLMAPAAYHRLVYGGEASQDVYRIGGTFIMVATVALAAGLAADTHVVVTKITGHELAGIVSSLAAFFVLTGLWHIWPWLRSSARHP